MEIDIPMNYIINVMYYKYVNKISQKQAKSNGHWY